MSVEQFEKRYGCLQSNYVTWRQEKESAAAIGNVRSITDCAFRSARESFARYCGLEEIPFEVMLWYESKYEDKAQITAS